MLDMKTGMHGLNVGAQERWASTVGGVVLTLAALWRKSLTGLLFLPVGVYLLYRGVWGRCFVYEWLGISTIKEGQAFMDDGPPPGVNMADEVAEASWESFPTSDAPAWTRGRQEQDG